MFLQSTENCTDFKNAKLPSNVISDVIPPEKLPLTITLEPGVKTVKGLSSSVMLETFAKYRLCYRAVVKYQVML